MIYSTGPMAGNQQHATETLQMVYHQWYFRKCNSLQTFQMFLERGYLINARPHSLKPTKLD
jgi:hypothetical protein